MRGTAATPVSLLVEHWLAAILLVVYALVLAYNAVLGRRASDSVEGYYVGGRNMSGVVVGVSFFATFASTNSYIGHAGKGYDFGLAWLVMAGIIVVFTYVSWRWVAPRMRAQAAHFGSVTVPHFLSQRYGDSVPVRLVSALVVVSASLLYLIAIFKGAGNLFEAFFRIPYEAAIGLTLGIVMAYTAVGGFVTVVRTDLVQGALMLVGSVMIFYFVTDAAGGILALPELAGRRESQHVFDINGGLPFALLLGIAFAGSLKLLVDPRQVSRFYGLRDDREAARGIWIAVGGLLVIQFCLFPVGIYAHFLLSGVTDTDTIVPRLLNDRSVFPLWASDCLIIAIVAAAMSSMDSVLLVTASVFTQDVVSIRRPPRKPVLWTRVVIAGFAVLAAALALDPPGGIVEITIFSGSLYAVCFVPSLLGGLFWRRGSALGAVVSMLLGISVLLGWRSFGADWLGDWPVHEVFPALIVAVAAFAALADWSGARLAPRS